MLNIGSFKQKYFRKSMSFNSADIPMTKKQIGTGFSFLRFSNQFYIITSLKSNCREFKKPQIE